MNTLDEIIETIREYLTKRVQELFHQTSSSESLKVQRKLDNSLVTSLDIELSNIVKKVFSESPKYASYNFYSEEEHSDFSFPCIIVDPIDGTRELVRGIPECCLSLSVFENTEFRDIKNFSFLINPFTGFYLSSSSEFCNHGHLNKGTGPLLGLVSRSEYEKGRFKNVKKEEIILKPVGSIAFKLGLLAAGSCDFVLSTRGKNVWDISAGSHLCFQRGINFYSNNKLIDNLSLHYYDSNLLWCRERDLELILSQLSL